MQAPLLCTIQSRSPRSPSWSFSFVPSTIPNLYPTITAPLQYSIPCPSLQSDSPSLSPPCVAPLRHTIPSIFQVSVFYPTMPGLSPLTPSPTSPNRPHPLPQHACSLFSPKVPSHSPRSQFQFCGLSAGRDQDLHIISLAAIVQRIIKSCIG
jgi:hypothetical protein